ncbi:Ppx/GppA family phosphatase [Lacticaseibacillus suibinensis]|uniref:Ppx/GppA family phosphatase n=1 Tax=Lacticaseibacillus suibinensis TaxID=2486011 RepID=UPI000F78A66D|nr:Ppx/GppA family phosphatase [Lacticaseibacillus suibinensis]
MTHFGVIDLGSNSARLSIWQIDGNHQPHEVLKLKEMVRLSEDMGPEQTLKPAAIARTLAALQRFSAAAKAFPELTLEAYATAAVRQAGNQKAFLRQVKAETGLTITVIPGTREAELDYLGVVNTLPIQNALIMDTGGASTELILVQNRKLIHRVSLPVGSVNLSERFLDADVVRPAQLFNLITEFSSMLNGIWWLRKALNLPIVALGGSNRTLAKIQRRREQRGSYEDIHGYRMATTAANKIYADILDKDLVARKEVPGLSKFRADIIVGGLTPVITMIRYLDSDRLLFSQYGLREGALYSYLNANELGQEA